MCLNIFCIFTFMKTSALRKRHKRKTKRITKRLIRLDEKNGGKKRIARNEKRKTKMQKKGTWSSKSEKGARKKKIKIRERELRNAEHHKELKKVQELKDKIKAIKKGEILFKERERIKKENIEKKKRKERFEREERLYIRNKKRKKAGKVIVELSKKKK